MGCKPASVGLAADEHFKRLRADGSLTNSTSTSNMSALAIAEEPLPPSACVRKVPVLYEELDVLSNRFTAVNGPNVSVADSHPTLLVYPLHAQTTGGTLNLQLTLNTVRRPPAGLLVCSGQWAEL